MKNQYNNELIFFLHIQKTAGMTLQELLRRNLGRSSIRMLMDFITGDTGEGLDIEQGLRRLTSKDRLFMGHYGYGVHNLFQGPYSYVTFLRDPVRRLVSLYYHSKLNTGSFYHKFARNRSIEDFLLHCPLNELDNGMTRQIVGDEKKLFMSRVPYGSCNAGLLEKARTNLEKDFIFVGIQERFMESVFLLSKTLGLRNPYFLSFNRGRGPKTKHDKDLGQKVRKKNSLDYALYEEYRDRFDQQFSLYLEDHPGAFETYLQENKRHQSALRRQYMLRLRTRRLLEKVLRRTASARPIPD